MIIFWRLVLAHFIADFTLQTNHVATWKRESRWGMMFHTLTHPFVSVVLLLLPVDFNFHLSWSASLINQPWVRTPWFAVNGWWCIAFIALTHWLEDVWRVWSIRETGSPDSTGFFLWDQLVHLTVILAVSPTADGARMERWFVPTLCAVLLAHFMSVLVFFIENDKWGKSTVLRDKKYGYMTERFVGAGLLCLPGHFAWLGVAWIVWSVVSYLRDRDERTWVHALVGFTSPVILGLTARLFLN